MNEGTPTSGSRNPSRSDRAPTSKLQQNQEGQHNKKKHSNSWRRDHQPSVPDSTLEFVISTVKI
ncbi:hypothetical protein BDZ94DRAFT_1268295 [Collybia nuda]|uniref:Uncharacterized protein n=1 Tax=Collybia nuda TaxID=64659 RepID=A0A9P5Y188_9AGAR|nr:hypothetical protein BDZ94DRAFT_1268295 [Collybia nuda]